jgi:hypothetical protein
MKLSTTSATSRVYLSRLELELTGSQHYGFEVFMNWKEKKVQPELK